MSNKKRAGFWLFTAAIVIIIAAVLTFGMNYTKRFGHDVILLTVVSGLTVWAAQWVLMVRK